MAKCLISKLVCEVVRVEVFWIVVVWINERVFAADDSLEKHVSNPAFRNNNIGARYLVILSADSFMRSKQLVVSELWINQIMHDILSLIMDDGQKVRMLPECLFEHHVHVF